MSDDYPKEESRARSAVMLSIFAGLIIIGAAVAWGIGTAHDESHDTSVAEQEAPVYDPDPYETAQTEPDPHVVRPDPHVVRKVPVDVDTDTDPPVVAVTDRIPDGYRYVEVEDWHGSGSVQTKAFHIDSEKWSIHWSADDPPANAEGVFAIEVSDGNESVARIAANSDTPRTGDTAYFDNGPGTFYLNIHSNADWDVEVRQLAAVTNDLDDEAELENVREKIAKDKARIEAEKAANPEAYAEKMAAEKLKLAKSLISKNDSAAKERLREIIDEYPDTDAADDAAELLKKL